MQQEYTKTDTCRDTKMAYHDCEKVQSILVHIIKSSEHLRFQK